MKSYSARRNAGKKNTKNILIPFVLLFVMSGMAAWLLIFIAQRSGSDVSEELKQAQNRNNKPFSLSSLHGRLSESSLERVSYFIDKFQRRSRNTIHVGLERSTRHLQRYKAIFRKVGLPEDLAYLPLIESSFRENAVSSAQAVGVWQFTKATGNLFQLETTELYDQRRDPIKSAWAAAFYLKHLYERYDNWDLAVAAYNCGESTIHWAQRKNRKKGLATDFWSLGHLPKETYNYVPAFIAAVIIAKNPGAYGFSTVQFMPQLDFENVKVTPGTHLDSLANYLNITEKALSELNPSLLKKRVPPGKDAFVLRSPTGTLRGLREQVKTLPHSKDLVLHQVQPKDNIESLASRFRTKTDYIMQANGLAADKELNQRKVVIIPL